MGFVFLLLSSTEGWGLPPCPEKGVWTECFGTYKSDDGTKYVGEWKADQSHGQGTETYSNGDKYVGEWKDGKFHGQGTMTYANGRVEKGEWNNNKYVKVFYEKFIEMPQGSGPFPVIIYSHGKGGLGSAQRTWSSRFVNWGFAAIFLDHYTLRNHYGTRAFGPKIAKKDLEWRKEDLVSILKEVKKNNLFDNSRITLAGQSRGGDFVLEGVLNEDARNRAGLNHPIKTGVLFYPSGRICFGSFEIEPIQRPLIVLYGSEDPGLSICWKNILPKLKHPNHPQVVKIYEGAHHAFDSDNFVGRCTKINVKGVKYDFCVRGDKGAFHQSVADLKAFLNIYAK